MTGFQKNGDEDAYRLLMESLDYDEKALPMFVAKYGDELDRVLDIPSLTGMVNEDPESDASKSVMGALKEYTELRNQGKSMHAPNAPERLDIYGKKLPTVDDFMKAFGSSMEEGESEDDARAAFTNPENPRYWGNYSDSDKNLAAYQLGYRDFNDMYGDLNRASVGFQTRNRVEGFGPNNETNFYIPWAISALKGLAVPRIKEAQAAGRDVTWQDITGDMAELGLNFVPGVGIMGKGGKLLARIGPKSELLGKGIGMGLESFAVPALSQGMDAGLLYNPNTLGTAESGLNTRSEFSLPAMAAQAGGIAGAKGAIKGGASMVKNAMETTMGKEGGGNAFNKVFESMERIGESTDDLIARRQAVLDRKAELASNRENVALPGDKDIPSSNSASVDDLKKANTFRILNSEAERIANSADARKAYRQVFANSEALDQAGNNIQDILQPLVELDAKLSPVGTVADPERFISIPLNDSYQLLLPAGTPVEKIQDALVKSQDARIKMEMFDRSPEGVRAQNAFDTPDQYKAIIDYMSANERTPMKGDVVQLPDGNLAMGDWLRKDGDRYGVRYPGADYDVPVESRPTPLQYQYESTHALPMGDDMYKGTASRNQVVHQKIMEDDLLRRKLYPYSTAKERARDVAGNAAFNAMSREGIVGNVDALNGKREKALWNRNLNRMREVITEPGIGPEERRRRQEAVMNVMAYGLDGLPEEIFSRDKAMYRAIAGRLGLRGWQHFSETDPQPSTSYSSAY